MAGWMRVAGVTADPAMDGISAALIETDGVDLRMAGAPVLRPFSARERAVLASAQPEAAELVETACAEALSRLPKAELVGFHATPPGWEARGRVLGSGQVLAQVLGVPVVWDFASADMELGGQGAPLAAFFHHALVRAEGARAPLAVLELGAWASVTWVDPDIPAPEHGCLAFVCGPGPAADSPDFGGGQGAADAAALERFVAHPFFRRMPPRGLEGAPEVAVAGLSVADARATRLAACAAGVAMAFDHFPRPPEALWLCGPGEGGLLAALTAGCDCPVIARDPAGAMGAQGVAYLAARVARGLPTTGPRTTGVPAPVGSGVLSQPGGANHPLPRGLGSAMRHKRID